MSHHVVLSSHFTEETVEAQQLREGEGSVFLAAA